MRTSSLATAGIFLLPCVGTFMAVTAGHRHNWALLVCGIIVALAGVSIVIGRWVFDER